VGAGGGEGHDGDYIVTQQADEPNDIGRNVLQGNRKKIAKFLMRTFTCRSTFLYGVKVQYIETQTCMPLHCCKIHKYVLPVLQCMVTIQMH
jgi:hypothetical protein